MIVTRHGHPIAVLLSIDDCIDLLLADFEEAVHARVTAWASTRLMRADEVRTARRTAKHQLLMRLIGPDIHARTRRLRAKRLNRGLRPSP